MATGVLPTKCSICLSTSPKYRCPRCSTRNCSLACVQTHKARNLCSGVRDPTKFLTRRQLTNPASFDSDFNLLTGIERGIEKADRVFAETADDSKDARRKNLSKALSQAGVRVWSAPKGVVRSRENQTCLEGRRKCLLWTIEWKFLGLRVLSSASETISLLEAHDIAVLDAYRTQPSKDKQQILRDYARDTGVVVPAGYQGRKDLMLDLGLDKAESAVKRVKESGEKSVEGMSLTNEIDGASALADTAGLTVSHDKSEPNESVAVAVVQEIADPTVSSSSQHISTDVDNISPIPIARTFFMHRPDISTAQKQIITPCNGKTSLRDILKGKTVREFPTFLVVVAGRDDLDWSHWHLFDETKSLIIEA